MKEEILSIASDLREGYMTTNEAKEHLLRLFGVIGSVCDHEWINNSFDQFGFLQEQICDKCGAKQSVP